MNPMKSSQIKYLQWPTKKNRLNYLNELLRNSDAEMMEKFVFNVTKRKNKADRRDERKKEKNKRRFTNNIHNQK